MKFKHRCWQVCTLLLLSAMAAGVGADADLQLQNRLRAHIAFLADDLLLGRQTGSDGYNIAANYVASQFRQTGLEPAGTHDSYFQQVPLKQALLVPDSAELTLMQGETHQRLVFAEHFYTRPSLAHTNSSVDAGLVFVGYGIDAPELGHQDYAGVDVRGKIVVQFVGQPHDFPSEEGAHFASGTQKTLAAVRHGAVGIVTIHTPRAAQRHTWERVTSRIGTPSMGWVNDEGKVHGHFEQIRGRVMMRDTSAAVLFEATAYDLETLLLKDNAGEDLPSFSLDSRLHISQQSKHSDLQSPNVVAMLPGSDPLLAGEFVVYTAHLDHLGVMPSQNEGDTHRDLINNGALDNASGVSVMLETARLFKNGEAPKRSVLFVAVTGEEKGLVGSEYFAMNPTVPIHSMVGVVNLDMPLLLYDFGDVIAFGAGRSSMGDAVRVAARSEGVEMSPDPFPEQNIFVRSDHYRFVQQGVPSVFLVTGMSSLDESVDAVSIFENFRKAHYHKPSDDLSLSIHYGAAAKFTRINVRIGELIANEPTRPNWHEGDFFGRTYAE